MRQLSEEELKKLLRKWKPPFDENLDSEAENDKFNDFDEDEYRELDFDHFD